MQKLSTAAAIIAAKKLLKKRQHFVNNIFIPIKLKNLKNFFGNLNF
jgi:hypothetical protein